jgi:HD superfamily phosphohydrolase YqeK
MPRDAGLPPWATVSEKRLAHIERVVALMEQWARAMGLSDTDRNRWLRAAWLHDAMRDAPHEELVHWAPESLGPRWILHGPAAAARARAEGETDEEILNAVRYHSVGHPEFGPAGRALYAADYLDPGRKMHSPELAVLAVRYPIDPGGVLFTVAKHRVAHLIHSGWPILEPTYRFWNRLALADGSLPS